MLVISRPVGKRIFIKVGDESFSIEVVRVSRKEHWMRHQVTLGFEAGPAVQIFREELYEKVETPK